MWHAESGDFAVSDSNFKFTINSVKTFSNLQNYTLFIDIDQ